MKVYRSRTRVIFARVTEEEFQDLANLCETTHASSMSEVVRAALRKMRVSQESEQIQLLGSLIELVRKFEARVEHLTAAMNERLAADKEAGQHLPMKN